MSLLDRFKNNKNYCSQKVIVNQNIAWKAPIQACNNWTNCTINFIWILCIVNNGQDKNRFLISFKSHMQIESKAIWQIFNYIQIRSRQSPYPILNIIYHFSQFIRYLCVYPKCSHMHLFNTLNPFFVCRCCL